LQANDVTLDGGERIDVASVVVTGGVRAKVLADKFLTPGGLIFLLTGLRLIRFCCS
tara:strand:+ start:385 stop:552 length:168 start_codon:yes stop_codon:yes gene_type:complete